MGRDPAAGRTPAAAAATAHPHDFDAPAWLQRTPLWRLKLRLQFTGWLQYVAPAAPAVLLLTLAGIGALVGMAPLVVVGLPLALGLLLLVVVGFDLVTVRWDLRPREQHPPRLAGQDDFEVMRARRADRSFQRRDLTDEDRAALLQWAWERTRPDVLLGSAPIRLEHVTVPLVVWPVVGAHEFLVAVAPREYDRTAVVDVGRSLQRVVTEATRAGISTCWIGPGADQSSVVATLGDRYDPDRDHVVCVCAVGYRSRFAPLLVRVMSARMHRTRLPFSRLFFADAALEHPVDVGSPPYDELGRTWEVCQWAPSSYNGQPSRAVVRAGERVERVDFVAATDSRYYAPVALGIWVANWETGCEALGIRGRVSVLDESAGPLPGGARYGATWLRQD
jgi:nitroreductase